MLTQARMLGMWKILCNGVEKGDYKSAAICSELQNKFKNGFTINIRSKHHEDLLYLHIAPSTWFPVFRGRRTNISPTSPGTSWSSSDVASST